MTPVRLPLLLLALVASLALAACGQEERDPGGFQTENAQVAETEGIYLELDEMKYQVQLSRQLNPGTVADRNLLAGLEPGSERLADDEVWFGVWMRVENEVDEPREMADDFEIVDTQQNVYRPLDVGPENVFAYRPTTIQGEELYPDPDSAAGERPPQGSVLLFKVRRFSLDNRPLELAIEGREGGRAIVPLDV